MNRDQVVAFADRLGELQVRALRVGGEQLLERVEAALCVARRHLERVSTGQLELVPAVEREIEASFERATEMIPGSPLYGA